MKRCVAWVPLSFALAACGGPPMAAYSPGEKNSDLPADKLYAAAEGALLDHGYLIEKRDPSGFRLETQKRTMAGSEIKQDKYEYSWIVETGGGKLKIRLECRRASGADSEDCGAERPEKLVKQQEQLIEEILSEARQ